MKTRMIFGMGTGRCGTWTLSRILGAQTGAASKHEGIPLPWITDVCQLWYQLVQIFVNADVDVFASVSFAWINYVGKLMGNLKDPKCICLKRPKDEVVESFLAHLPYTNHWTNPESRHWDSRHDTHMLTAAQWPKYDLPRREALGQYWEDYYAHAGYLARQYPDNFLIMDMNAALNTEKGQRRMLSFAGFNKNQQRIFLNRRLNALHKPKGDLEHVYAG